MQSSDEDGTAVEITLQVEEQNQVEVRDNASRLLDEGKCQQQPDETSLTHNKDGRVENALRDDGRTSIIPHGNDRSNDKLKASLLDLEAQGFGVAILGNHGSGTEFVTSLWEVYLKRDVRGGHLDGKIPSCDDNVTKLLAGHCTRAISIEQWPNHISEELRMLAKLYTSEISIVGR
jgi:hypothetical protein